MKTFNFLTDEEIREIVGGVANEKGCVNGIPKALENVTNEVAVIKLESLCTPTEG